LAYLGRIDESIKAYQEGLVHEPDNAQLKEGLEGVRAQKTGNKGRSGKLTRVKKKERKKRDL